jgi:hypothetical protein
MLVFARRGTCVSHSLVTTKMSEVKPLSRLHELSVAKVPVVRGSNPQPLSRSSQCRHSRRSSSSHHGQLSRGRAVPPCRQSGR